MSRRKRQIKKVLNPVLPRNAMERIQDTAFETRVKTLTEQRRWQELTLAFALHGSMLADREDSRET
jgi:hypothetical protein